MDESQNQVNAAFIRIGECRNCGECCRRLDGINNKPTMCPAYLPDGVGTHCAIYQNRPQVCRVSPRTPRDILCVPDCGFQFVDAETGRVIHAYDLPSTEAHLHMAIKRSKSLPLP